MSANLAETQKLLREMAAEARELQTATGGSVTDSVGVWLASQYAAAAHEKLSATQDNERWQVLRSFVQDWTLLRRGDHNAARLQLDREKLDWQRANSAAQKEKEFREWIQRPEIRKEIFPEVARGISTETLEKIERELRLL